MRLRTRLVGFLASIVVLALVAVVPVLLAAVSADLLATGLPTLDQLRAALSAPDDGTLVLRVVLVAAWVAWAVLTVSILAELGSRLRGVRAPHLPGLGVPQLAARQLVGAAALLFVALPSVSGWTAAPAVAAPVAVVTAADSTTAPAATVPATSVVPAQEASTPPLTYTVQPGDSLSAIAAAQLGDVDRWPDIVAANPALAGNPSLIYAGTELVLPAPAATPLASAATTYTVQPGDSLSRIAAAQLGDPDRWPEIFQASTTTVQPDGRRITDPDAIDIGQVLTIPVALTTLPVAAPASEAGTAAPDTTGTTAPVTAPPTVLDEASPSAADGTDHVEPDDTAQVQAPLAAAVATPASDPVPAGTRQGQDVADVEPETATAGWMVAGLTGGGAVLAGALYTLLAHRRRERFRARRPGRTLAAPPAVLAPVEKTISAIGAITAPTVEHVDTILRRLAATATAGGTRMVDLAAVELTDRDVVLHLATPAHLPGPWTGSADGYHWQIPAGTAPDQIGPPGDDQPAPYPLLATIGTGEAGQVWLLNLEGLQVTIDGDPLYAADLARYLVAEIACNPWSTGSVVDCVGVGTELAGLNPDRVRVHDTRWDATDDPIGEALLGAVRTVDRCADLGQNLTSARATAAGADAWTAHLLLVDAATDHPVLDQLLDLLHDQPERTGTCVVLNGTRPGATDDAMALHVGADGRLSAPSVGLDLVAVGLTSDEALGCAALLAQAEHVEHVPVGADEDATDGWRSWSDHAGALRPEHTSPRTTDTTTAADATDPASSLLADQDETYLAVAATTLEDLSVLAPRVTDMVAEQVQASDPTLDADVAAWFAQGGALPKLRLLGPVRAVTRGKPLVKRKPYMTELLTFIALHPHGATPAEVADAFGITTSKVREYVRLVREWLGTNPRTGEPHLPDARYGQGAAHRKTAVYEVVDLLVDLDLFRRLRVRGQARGASGIEDLRTALRLVEGRPFDAPVQRRAGGGWTWLIDGDRLDEHAVVAIVDVAHLVTTHALATGDLQMARVAAETAALAAPFEEIPRLDLAAVAAAEGRSSEARRIVRDEVANRTDDDGAPPELAERTEEILERHRDWFGTKAS